VAAVESTYQSYRAVYTKIIKVNQEWTKARFSLL